jgi:energy-coupling factor transporter ATP-binding protein EcfA2
MTMGKRIDKPAKPPASVLARIDTITICDFRGFCGNVVQTITLHNAKSTGEEIGNEAYGKNLLLYGENGSGKSTIYTALAELFTPHSRQHFDDDLSKPTCLTNKFADMTKTEGRVTLEFISPDTTAPPVDSIEWRIRQPRPTGHPYYDDLRRTSGFLDYRAILRTHFLDYENAHINIFSLLIETILREIELPTFRTTIGEAWKSVLDERGKWQTEMGQLPEQRPGDPIEMDKIGFEPSDYLDPQEDEEDYDLDEMYRRFLRRKAQPLSDRINEFQQRLAGRLIEVQEQANKFLELFDGFVSVILYDADKVPDLGADLDALLETRHLSKEEWQRLACIPLRAKFRDLPLDHPGVVLNEARLTAIALTLYLAALKVETPAATRLSAARILVLDDVLIGLDMTHRLPVLDLIRKEFAETKGWQVFLFTFDRAWYEVARQRLPDTWKRYELYAVRIGDYEKPVLVPDDDSLLRALAFLEKGEIKAAAVHIRSKFEAVSKKACEQFKCRIPYTRDVSKIPSHEFWDALKTATVSQTTWQEKRDNSGVVRFRKPWKNTYPILPEALKARIEHARSWVMNPLSHDDSLNRYRNEIEDALYAVEELERHVDHAMCIEELPSPPHMLIDVLNSIIETRSTTLPATSDSATAPATDNV